MLYDPKWEQDAATRILLRARELIRNKDNWTHSALARDRRGNECNPEEDGAISFCALGAIVRAGVELEGRPYQPGYLEAFDRLGRAMAGHIPNYNNTETHSRVLDAFDLALSATQEK